MPRNIRWDESVNENTLCLVEALLLHADDEFKDEELKTVVYVKWATENQLRVTGFKEKHISGKRKRTVEVGTRKEDLLKLLKKAGKSLKLPKLKNEASISLQKRELDEIQTALDCLKKLGVREDERSAKNQGYWIFKLMLKHQTEIQQQNLEVVKQKWKENSKTTSMETSQTAQTTYKSVFDCGNITMHQFVGNQATPTEQLAFFAQQIGLVDPRQDYARSQFKAYCNAWKSLQALRLAGDDLWEMASKDNLVKFASQLRDTTQIAHEGEIFFEESDREQLLSVLKAFNSFRFGKKKLIDIYSTRDIKVWNIAHIQIDVNRRYKIQYEDILDTVRISFKQKLSS